MRKIAVYRSLISYIVPELQSFEDTKMEAKMWTQNKKIN